MSDHVSHSYVDCEGTSSKPTRSYQSMWMGHWVGTSCNAGITSQVDSDRQTSEDAIVNTKKLHLPLKDELDPSSQRLALSLTNFSEPDNNHASASKFPSFPVASSTEECLGRMNVSKAVDNSLAIAVPYSDRFTKFIQGRPSTAEKGKMSSFMSRYESKEHFSSTDLKNLEHHTRSSVFLCEEKIDNNNPPSRSMVLHNPSSNKTDVPLFMGQQFQNISTAGCFSGQGKFREEIRKETSFQCQGNVKISKIFTTSDSTDELDDQGGFSMGRPSFPFRDNTMISAHQPKVNMMEKFIKFSSGGLPQDKSGVRLQLLSSSSDSYGKCNKDGENNPEPQFKNESSAETDTMDIDILREQNILPGVNSSHPKKNKDKVLDETTECTFSSLPKRDKEVGLLPLVQIQKDKQETSTLRAAQTLETSTHLLSKSDAPSPSRLISRPHMVVDPGSRWLKRLKLISLPDSLGFGSIREEEEPFLREIIKRKNILKLKLPEKAPLKDQTLNEKSNIIVQEQEQDRETLLSHAWIQRWCRSKAANMKGKIGKKVIREPMKFKLEKEELLNKQFPSIAAMALMGKTMAGFRSCDLKRKGSSVVWNTKSF